MRRVASLFDILNEFGVELDWYLSNWNGQWWWKGYVYINIDQADDCLYDRILKNWVDDDDKNDDIKYVDEVMIVYVKRAVGLITC